MTTLAHFIDTLLLRLIWTTAQATVLIGVLWLLGRSMQRMSPAMRCMLWWLVAAQLLLGITVSTPVELPWLPASTHAVTTVTHKVVEQTTTDAGPASTTTPMLSTAYDTPAAAGSIASAWSWTKVIVALWVLGVLLQVILAFRQWRESHALVSQSQPLRDATLQLLCAEQADTLGLRHIPHLRVSDEIVSPQVTGLWRPLVLLPAGQTLSSEELSMALGHELAHLRRGDLWLGWVPAVAQCLFFFHPLVKWAMREYAVYREAACDAQVVQRNHAAPQSYGHLLLRLGVAHPVHASLAGASTTFQSLKRRLLLLQHSMNDTTPRAPGWLLVAVIALVGILPYRVTASNSVRISTTDAAQVAIPPPPPAPPAPPAAPPAPPAPVAVHGSDFDARHVDIDTHSNASYGIALFDDQNVMINGSDVDLADAKRLYKKGQPLLWFRRGDKAYVVHDEASIRQAKQAYAPIARLAEAQGELAGKQGEMAGRQGGLAARQGALAARQAEIESRRASIESQQAATLVNQSPQEAAAQEASVKGQLAGLDRESEEINRENADIDRHAADLAEQAADLSKQAEAMSKQQEAASRQAEQNLDKVLDEILAKGQAQPVSR
jgi:bla regulator protein blaR1